jgi:hypothetical protein
MKEKIMLLALGTAVSVAMLALPAVASAKIPLHIKPQPAGAKTVDGIGVPFRSWTGGTTVTCSKVHGTATFTSTTGGTMELTFGPHCAEPVFNSTCTGTNPVSPAGTYTTNTLNFELVTLAGKLPGLEMTAQAGSPFVEFTCAGGLVTIKIEAHHGLLGRISTPGCGGSSTEPVIKFEQEKHGIQKHRFLEGTPTTEYNLKKGGETGALNAELKFTLGAISSLECT